MSQTKRDRAEWPSIATISIEIPFLQPEDARKPRVFDQLLMRLTDALVVTIRTVLTAAPRAHSIGKITGTVSYGYRQSKQDFWG